MSLDALAQQVDLYDWYRCVLAWGWAATFLRGGSPRPSTAPVLQVARLPGAAVLGCGHLPTGAGWTHPKLQGYPGRVSLGPGESGPWGCLCPSRVLQVGQLSPEGPLRALSLDPILWDTRRDAEPPWEAVGCREWGQASGWGRGHPERLSIGGWSGIFRTKQDPGGRRSPPTPPPLYPPSLPQGCSRCRDAQGC